MKLRHLSVIAAAAILIVGCGGSGSSGGTTLTGGGSTFAQNMVETCRTSYQSDKTANPDNAVISYSGTGSGTGRTNFANGTFAFALTDSAYKEGAPSDFVYVPMVAGPIAIAYHLNGVAPEGADVQMSASTIAKVFAGQITKWNDAALAADNPGVTLPGTAIRVAYRAGNSGTSSNLTKYLAATSPSIWTKPASDDFSGAFPGTLPTNGTFQSASGSDGVSNYVADNDGAITYTELSFVNERASKGVKSVKVANNAGEFVAPSAESTAAFYANAAVGTDGLATVDYATKEKGAYLINAISYGIASTTVSAKNAEVRSFFDFMLNSCAPASGAALGYAPLTGAIKDSANQFLSKISPN